MQHQQLLDMEQELGFEQMQLSPSRESNILDLYLNTYPSLVKSCYTVPSISNHHMVVVDCDVKPRYKKKQKHRKLYIYKKANWTNIKSNLRALSMYITHSPSSVETKWQDHREAIFKAMSHDIPTKWSSNRSHHPWLSSKLKKCIKKKHKLMQLAKKTGIPSYWTKYKQHKSITQKQVRQAHLNYVNTFLNKSLEHGNNKPFWKYVKARRNDNIGVAAIKNNGILYHDSKTNAEHLNHQFKSVFTMDDDTDNLPTMSHPKYPNIENITISIEGVEKLLDNINIHKASGPDKIPNIILETCSKEMSPALANIFQQSLDTGTLPNDWRNANIRPIF